MTIFQARQISVSGKPIGEAFRGIVPRLSFLKRLKALSVYSSSHSSPSHNSRIIMRQTLTNVGHFSYHLPAHTTAAQTAIYHRVNHSLEFFP